MTLSIVIFLIGVLGFILNRKSLILLLVSIELILLAVTLLLVVSSYGFDDSIGQSFAVFIITVAAAETAIGLGILVSFYRLRGTVTLYSETLYLTIICLPFLGSAVAAFIGRTIGQIGAIIITTGSIFVTGIIVIIAFFEVALSWSQVSLDICNWINSYPLTINWGFLFDDLTVSILIAVVIVSFFVHLYSCSYIAEDPHVQWFISLLSFFTASIILLVTGDNLLVIFVGT